MPHVIIALIREHFDRVYRADYTYRMTGIILSDLRGEGETQLDLFGEVARAERARTVYEAIDQLDAKYGKHTVFLDSSYAAINGVQHQGKRDERPRRQAMLLKGEGECELQKKLQIVRRKINGLQRLLTREDANFYESTCK